MFEGLKADMCRAVSLSFAGKLSERRKGAEMESSEDGLDNGMYS